MIVNLEIELPSGETREFEFRRPSVLVGAGARSDILVPSQQESVRIARLDVSASGVRVVHLAEDEPITVILPDDERRAPNESLLLPVGTVIEIGKDEVSKIRIVGLRRQKQIDVTVLGELHREPPDEVIADLGMQLRGRTLKFVEAVSGVEDPNTVANEVERFLKDGNDGAIRSVQLLLPDGEDNPWDRVALFGSSSTRPPVDSLGWEPDSELLQHFVKSQVLAATRGDDSFVLVPFTSDGRVAGVLSVETIGAPSDTYARLSARLRALHGHFLGLLKQFERLSTIEVLREENRYFRARQRRHYLFKDLVTESPAMKRVHREVGKLVLHDDPVLLTGEAGTGKELLARALHHLGPRASGIMISQHCGRTDDDELDFLLFGYGRGEAGKAVSPRRGIFELASGGTVFLDEVHALAPRLQQKLQRMLVENEIFRIGESFARRVNVRVVASTHRELPQLVEGGLFRRDLAESLLANSLMVPPLRDRREDIGPLARSFVSTFARRYQKQVEEIEAETLNWLVKLDWPGNVRELLTVIERAVLRATPDQEALRRADFELR